MTTNALEGVKAARLSRELSEAEIAAISGAHGGQQSCSCPEGYTLFACVDGIALCVHR